MASGLGPVLASGSGPVLDPGSVRVLGWELAAVPAPVFDGADVGGSCAMAAHPPQQKVANRLGVVPVVLPQPRLERFCRFLF